MEAVVSRTPNVTEAQMSSTTPEVEVKGQVGDWVVGKIVKGKKDKQVEVECGLKELTFTDITIVLDKSGSMGSIREATVKSINDYMRAVDEVPGDGCWTMVTFDDPGSAVGAGEAFPRVVFGQVDTKHRPLLELQDYVPRGGTALIDAAYTIISGLRERVKDKGPQHKVLVVIVTDGQENSSKLYTRDQLRELIGRCTKDGWQFLYLGANQDAFAESAKLNIDNSRSTFFGGVKATWQADAKGIDLCLNAPTGSATAGTRAWKADGNESAVGMLSSAMPEFKATKEVK